MADDVMMLVLRMMIGTAKVVWKIGRPILFFSGLWAVLLVSIIGAMFEIDNMPVWIWVIAWFIVAYSLIQNTIRLFKRDKSFKLYKLLFKGTQSLAEKRSTNPKVNTTLSHSEPTGVVFGRYKKDWVCKPENVDGHILVVGGSGSGKSAAIAIPTLLTWKEPIFAIDIKGELHEKTKHCRPNSKVFSLTHPDGYGFNPFYLIDDNRSLIEQMKSITDILIQIPPDTKDPFWKNSARSYLCACLIWAYEMGCPFTEIMRLIQVTPPNEMIAGICGSEKEKALLFANQFKGMPDETLAGVYSEVSNVILPFASDEQLRSALSKPREQCISPSDLENNISIYIHLEEHRLEQLKNFLTLIVGQFLKAFEQRPDSSSNRVLFLLDEFARLGKIEVMNGLATLRSKGITICLIFQSMAQLDVIYGQPQRKVICDNCSYWSILRVTDPDSQQYISSAIGTYDKRKKSYSTNQQDFKVTGGSGTSISEEEKRIVKPEELNKLDDFLILISPYGFNRVRKAYYFKDKYFQKLIAK